MADITIQEQVHQVTVQHDGTVQVATVGIQGPPGPEGPPGDGGSGLDPEGEEVITGDWLFDRETLRVGDDESNNLRIGLNTASLGSNGVSVGNGTDNRADSVVFGNEAFVIGWRGAAFGAEAGCSSNAVAIGSNSGANRDSIAVGTEAFCQASSIAIGRAAGQDSTGAATVFIGRSAGRDNNRSHRLIIDNIDAISGNLIDPLIDGRFRDGTDSDSFEYSKGVKVNGHLEATDQLILRSPDGTRWAITVDDSGNLSTAPATEEITP